MTGLALACHPLPSLAVTAIGAGLGGLAGLGASRVVLLAAAVLTGQLSIGWGNDRLDWQRDQAVSRSDKPLATGRVGPRTVAGAAGLAVVATVVLSLLLGPAPGVVALVTVASGWSYNLGLKATMLSWLPFAVSFGLLPAIATLARPGSPWPAPAAIVAGALLGVAAHVANVLPDLDDDAATGVRGLPHRLGRRFSVALTPLVLVGAAIALVAGGAGGAPGWAVPAASAVVGAGAAVIAWRRPSSRLFFAATVLIAGTDLVLFAVAGGRLVGR